MNSQEINRSNARSSIIIGCAAFMVVATAGPAFAGETVRYEAEPAWVERVPLDKTDAAKNNGSALLIFDSQQKIENGLLWNYSDAAMRVTTPQVLAQLSNVSTQWSPDDGDLIVHEMSITRAGETLDLLGLGMRFSTLRREEALEQRQLNGVLTANALIEGLQVGDVFRLRYSVTRRDKALKDKVQAVLPLVPEPVALGFGRIRVLWPSTEKPNWQALAPGVKASTARRGALTELTLALPIAKPPEMPGDAPLRFQPISLFEISDFKDWADVSRTMAPLYQVDGLIAPGSVLEKEADRIAGAEQSALGRTQAALRLVQDEIRYFAVSMDGGNYVPQPPAETWRMRYGDCKAKTLLLLALLDRLGVKAEPVLASTRMGDLVPRRIASAAAFDHVLVRAEVDGKSLWLDGTGSGARIDDIHDTPPFRNVLPLRLAGADLMPVPTRGNARALSEIDLVFDESSSIDLPAVFDGTAVIRGNEAIGLTLAANAVDEKQKAKLVRGFFADLLDDAQYASTTMQIDPAGAAVTLRARGITTTSWSERDTERVRSTAGFAESFEFSPDRSKPEWASLPVMTAAPSTFVYRLKIRLPDGGRGYAIEGQGDADITVGGAHLTRKSALEGGVFTMEERLENTGVEIAPDQIAAERERASQARAAAPVLVAPADATRRWNLGTALPAATQFKAMESVLAAAAKEPGDKFDIWTTWANIHKGIGDYKAARADLDKAIAIRANSDTYLQRSRVAMALNDLPGALADARKARELDPSSADANMMLAQYLARKGDIAGAMALLDPLIAQGGENRKSFELAKADILGRFGSADEALALLADMAKRRPNSAEVFNGECWIRALRNTGIENGARICTSAIELAQHPAPALDSRAVMWFRLGRTEDALRDLDAALNLAPGMAASRYVKGVILARLGRTEEGEAEFRIARALDPLIAQDYSRYGIAP